jgi:hypothetical protein
MMLFISYPFDSDYKKIQAKIEKVVKKFHAEETGSGAGFGMRDLNFEFKKEKDLDGAIQAVKALKIEGLTF